MISALSPAPRARVAQYALLLSILCLGVVAQLGCSNSAVPEPAQASSNAVKPKQPTGPAAQELLAKMRAAYSGATSYTDNTSVVFYAVVRSTGGEVENPFTRSSVAFERPNRFHLSYQKYIASPQEEHYEVVSDGKSIRSAADELPDQVQEAIAPSELTAENFIPESKLCAVLFEDGILNSLPQLALLLANESELAVFPGQDQAKTLTDATLDDKNFHRVQLPSPAGKRVLWIDQENFSLRRLEIPIDHQLKAMNPRNQFSRMSVWIDFEEVTFNPEIEPSTFTLAIPEGARRVRRFIPPPPDGPEEYLGKPVGQFAFQTLAGEAVTPEALEGKVAVLDFWSTNCQPCRTQAPVINEIYQHFSNNEQVEFLAVSTDPAAVPDETIVKTLASWGSAMPVVRDLKSSGYHELNVRQTPTLLLVDQVGRLQSFQVGTHSKAEPVITAIQQLLDGKSLVAMANKRHDEHLAKYEEALDASTIRGSIAREAPALPVIAPQLLPENLRLKQLWQTSKEQLSRPDDLLLLEDGATKEFRLLVLDTGEAIVELDGTGEVMSRHELPEPDPGNQAERTHGFLRSWSNASGKRWTVASGVGWQQVHVFDKAWQPVLSFPDGRHSGIGDVLFDDLAESDTPVMYVGYHGGWGVQGGTLDGRRLWTNRRLDHVLQVGVGPKLTDGLGSTWCTSTRGTLLQVGTDGKTIQERYIPGQALLYFATQPDGNHHCGLSAGDEGQYTAVGFAPSDAVAWEYPLPAGEYASHLSRIQAVQMPDGTPAWLVVAANGSLHWLSLSGELIDRFDTGSALNAVRMGSLGERTVLLLATDKKLTAWEVTAPAKPAAPTEAIEATEAESAQDDKPDSSKSEESTQPDPTDASAD